MWRSASVWARGDLNSPLHGVGGVSRFRSVQLSRGNADWFVWLIVPGVVWFCLVRDHFVTTAGPQSAPLGDDLVDADPPN